MISLSVDIGNTFIKVGLFKDNVLTKVLRQLTEATLEEALQNLHYEAAMVCSVRTISSSVEQILTNKSPVSYLNAQTSLPFTITYGTPLTLGADRIAGVAGASALYPQQNTLSIDVGTCITYDLINAEQQFEGGGIAPGLQMRLQAMHTFTERLPLINKHETESENIPLVGGSTRDCMLSGAVYGTGAEITEMIRMYADKYADLQVVVCGGDASLLSKYIKQSHRVVPELILIGLNRILTYNVL